MNVTHSSDFLKYFGIAAAVLIFIAIVAYFVCLIYTYHNSPPAVPREKKNKTKNEMKLEDLHSHSN